MNNPQQDVQESARWMLRGAAWMFLLRLIIRLATLVNMVVLARLLTPDDFGIIALAVATLGLVEVLADFSPATLLIQRAKLERADYDTVFTLSLLRGALLALLAVLCAPLVVRYYDNPNLEWIFWGLALRVLLEGLRNPGAIDFLKGLDYRRDMIVIGLPRVLGVAASISLALILWPDYRALLAGLIAGEVAGMILSYLMHPFRPRLTLVKARDLMGASVALLGLNFSSWLYGQAFVFVLGKAHGLRATSLYAVANDLAMLAVNEIAGPLRRALLPGFALLRHNPTELQRQFILSLSVTLVVAAPIAVGTALVAAPAVRLVFGSQWAGAVPALQMLAPHGVLFVAAGAFSNVLLGLGQTWTVARINLLTVALAVPLMVWAAAQGAMQAEAMLPADPARGAAAGAALALSVCDLLLLALFLRSAGHHFGFRLGSLLIHLWRVGVALLAMAGAVWLTTLLPLPAMTSGPMAALHLAVQVPAGALGYALALLGLWHLAGRPAGPESRLLELARDLTVRLRR